MADNVAVVAGAYTATVASKDIGGVQFQKTLAVDSGGGDATDTVNHAVKVAVVANSAGATLVTDADTVTRGQANTILGSSVLYAGDGTNIAGASRKILSVFSNALAGTEKSAAGTPTWGQATMDAVTATGVQIVAANAARRRVVICKHGSADVYLAGGNITAGSTTEGFLFSGPAGSTVALFTTAAIKGTVAAATEVVSFFQEVLG